MVKDLPAIWKTWVQFLSWEGPLEEGLATHFQYSYLETLHGERSLVGYSPQGREELHMTECVWITWTWCITWALTSDLGTNPSSEIYRLNYFGPILSPV